MIAAASPADRDGSGTGTRAAPGFAAEPTAIGLQSLVPGVAPISIAERLAARAAAPLEPRKPQRPCGALWESRNRAAGALPPGGLFDLNVRNQLDLFQQRES